LEPRAKRFEDHQNTAKHQKNLTNPNVLLQKEKVLHPLIIFVLNSQKSSQFITGRNRKYQRF